MAFDVVFIPGLAEGLFPEKIVEDPILLDTVRTRLDENLATNIDRITAERLALKIAVGVAREAVVLSYPRMDMEKSRPRVPSFYGLEAMRAAIGTLPSFDELAKRAQAATATRAGWPAPAKAEDAIDAAEYDLALLDRLLRMDEPRFRWNKKKFRAKRDALIAHGLIRRTYQGGKAQGDAAEYAFA